MSPQFLRIAPVILVRDLGASVQYWKDKVGFATSVNWPVGLGGKGNEGVTQEVKNTTGTIGYVELIYAVSNKLPYAQVKNSTGAFVVPSLASVTSAAASARFSANTDFRVSITNAPGKDSYPISSFTWLLVRPIGREIETEVEHRREALQRQLSGGRIRRTLRQLTAPAADRRRRRGTHRGVPVQSPRLGHHRQRGVRR